MSNIINVNRRDFVKVFGLASGGLILGCNLSSNKKEFIPQADDGTSFAPNLFIQLKKDKEDIELERIQVNKGISDLGFSEVIFLSHNPKDAIVVLKGAYYVNAELNKGEFEEHEH